MRDVAALAGVSLKTVSRVVNEEAAVSADYRHNLVASNLRRGVGRTSVVGVLLQDLENSFSSGLLRAIEDSLRERHIAVLAASLDEEPDRERLLVADLVSRRVDGLVIMPATQRQDYLVPEIRAGLPVVFVDRRPRAVDSDSVTVDNMQGGYEAMHHLLARGHRRVAVLTDLPTIETAVLRLGGVRRAMRGAGVELDDNLVHTGLRTVEAAEEVVTRMLASADPPTGIAALRNILSVGALRALRATGQLERVAVVGFDDFPTAELVGLTVIRQHVSDMGKVAADLLLTRLDGEDGPPRHERVRHLLVERGSGEVPPGR
jgi:LacI family transcriptional regulator